MDIPRRTWRMPSLGCARLFGWRHWLSLAAAFSLCQPARLALAQNDANAQTQSASSPAGFLQNTALDLRLGPFDFHPRLITELLYDDNLLYSVNGKSKEAAAEWLIQPAVQAVAGDDAGLVAYRDQNQDVLTLSPGNLIIQPPEDRPGKLFILDYGPRFQIFDKYSANNSVDEFATLDLLWPMNNLVLGVKQDYQLQKEAIIEAGQRTTVETISTALSEAYQFGDKTSMESDFRRISFDYQTVGLIGYTEYNTEDWFNYEVEKGLPVSLGVLAGLDDVANHQDQNFVQLRARARYNYTEKLIFDVSVGGELRQYENGNPDTLTPVFNIAGEFRPLERTSLRLSGSRELNASIFNGFNFATTGATLDARQGITDRFTVDLSAGYYAVDLTSVSGPLVTHSEDYYIVRLSLETKIVSHLTSQIFAQWLNRPSSFYGDLDDDQIGAQLALSF
jgi:hypothetical protein